MSVTEESNTKYGLLNSAKMKLFLAEFKCLVEAKTSTSQGVGEKVIK